MSSEDIRLAHILTHPVRHQISKLLQKGKRYIAEISNELGIDRKVISFHIRIMEEEGLIRTSLERKTPPSGNPVLVRYASLTDKAKEIMERFNL